MVKIGIVGGSGLDDPKLLSDFEEKELNTPYGKPSSKYVCGKISGVEVCILARHGKKHDISPSLVNYRANIHGFKMLGCTHILATSAVGSLREEIKPGNLVFPSQFIDFTKLRKNTFFDSIGEVKHTSMAEPFDSNLRKLLCKCCDELKLDYNSDKTIITVEGPRFSTKAESHMFRSWGADIIGMTNFPEVALANEIGIPYQTISMSTDYDCWKDDVEGVSFEMVLKTMNENSEKVKKLLLAAIPKIDKMNKKVK
jgi:5'-methylthioadenosine phosphorylase